MGTLQDKVNERHELNAEELAEQRVFKEREVALQNQMNDAMVAINTLHEKLVGEVKGWWRKKIAEKKLNVEELVYGIEFSADGEKAAIVVADFVRKPVPQELPKAARKHIKAVPDLPETDGPGETVPPEQIPQNALEAALQAAGVEPKVTP